MSSSQLIGILQVVLFCSSIAVVLFDNAGISKCLNTLFLLSSHLRFIKALSVLSVMYLLPVTFHR